MRLGKGFVYMGFRFSCLLTSWFNPLTTNTRVSPLFVSSLWFFFSFPMPLLLKGRVFGLSGSATSASFVVGGFSDRVQVSASLYICVALSEKTQTSAKALRLCQYLSKHVRCRCEHLDCHGIIKTSVSVIKAMA